MKPLLIGLVTLTLLARASAQENSVRERAGGLRKLDLRVFKPGSDAAKQAPDLLWQYFKARRDQVNRDSLGWKFDTRAAWEKLRDEKIAHLKAYLGHSRNRPRPCPFMSRGRSRAKASSSKTCCTKVGPACG